MNLSIESSGLKPGHWDELRIQHKNQLFVVAAGNGKGSAAGRQFIDFETVERHAPAGLGGNESANIVSVAAHDAQGDLPHFSNRGDKSVTLAAPGCEIASFIPGPGAEEKYSGTSQAAPLVTLVAAQLAFYDMPAIEIKRRLIASVDFRADLQDKLYSGGVLNVRKALGVFTDLVEVEEGQDRRLVSCTLKSEDKSNGKPVILFARRSPATNQLHSPTPIDLGRVLKVTPVGPYVGVGTEVRVVYARPTSGTSTLLDINIDTGQLNSRLACISDDKPVQLSALRDVIPRSSLLAAQ